ncbi:hypothetical protein HIM_04802 [Hirsutella minnesotensis 3608]|uniref:Chromatin structure-remodeling complex subunit RSC1 n=1 Tax=Hirsutella minnesotensis 3608 TaxID=1043627 RepID=A0A0F7ZPK2_9HYPO|nr:hypothetical protein HIM_04802 [Hirsutella minnesotensis 3608]
MSTRRAAAPERRKSVREGEADQDVEMNDCADNASNPKHESSQEASDEDNEAGKRDLLQLIHTLSTHLCEVEENGEELAAGFQRIPNRRTLPDYFDIISDPIAFSTIRSKVQKKQYTAFAEFVKDVAQICHNAQVYNRPSAPVFGAAVRLRDVFRHELEKLVEKGEISATDATLPDLGDLPSAEELSSRGSEASDMDEEEEEEEEEEEDEEDDDDDDGISTDDERQRGRRHPQRSSRRWQREARQRNRNEDKDDEAHRKRGRPPMVLTPTEARVAAILKGLRKFRDQDGGLLVSPFEKLPDKTLIADYYQIIKSPMALESIKKKCKRKKYNSVDEAVADLDLMFENAKIYNEDDSDVYQAAVELQHQARALADAEKAKPDDDFRDEDGKLPLVEVHHNGNTWRVGDWVHIRNPNDLAKPIVAQIFRTWQDRTGQKWINACWYYRPEQTVHRHQKHFYEREVVKTGQYRDHQVEDVLDRCFVMFVTRFNKGRPRGFPPEKDVYVCESRYNEENFRFNKIKTWASCVPDEVREKDYEMDLFDVPRRMRKMPSPIKHLLREDARDTDELPRPTWGSPNAPPIIGAVHRRPPDSNESPPPEPTPPPRAPTTADARTSMLLAPRDGAPENLLKDKFHSAVPPASGHYNNAGMTPHFQPGTPASGGPPVHQTPVPIPHPPHHVAPVPPPHMPIRPIQFQHPQPQPQPAYVQNYPQAAAGHQQPVGTPVTVGFNNHSHGQGPTRPSFTPSGNPSPHPKAYNPPRPPEVYTLPENAHFVLPPSLRQEFQQDEAGRILLYTTPPLDRSHRGIAPASAGLGHSVKYLAGRDEWVAERSRKRKRRDDAKSTQLGSHNSLPLTDQDLGMVEITQQAAEAVNEWFRRLDRETQDWRKDAHLEEWGSTA